LKGNFRELELVGTKTNVIQVAKSPLKTAQVLLFVQAKFYYYVIYRFLLKPSNKCESQKYASATGKEAGQSNELADLKELFKNDLREFQDLCQSTDELVVRVLKRTYDRLNKVVQVIEMFWIHFCKLLMINSDFSAKYCETSGIIRE